MCRLLTPRERRFEVFLLNVTKPSFTLPLSRDFELARFFYLQFCALGLYSALFSLPFLLVPSFLFLFSFLLALFELFRFLFLSLLMWTTSLSSFVAAEVSVWADAQWVEHLPSLCPALGPFPSTICPRCAGAHL